MNAACKKIVAFLLVLSLVTFPLLASVAQTEAPESDHMMIGVSSDHANGIARRDAHGDDRVELEDSMNRTSTAPTDSLPEFGIACDPCCTVGIGHCVAVIFALSAVPHQKRIHASNIASDEALTSRKVAPPRHPPKVHS